MITKEITWVSVDEALPNKNGRYLVAYEFWTSEYSYDIVYFSKTGKGLIFFNGDISKDKNIWYRDDSEYGDVPIRGVKYWAEIPRITEKRNQ